MLRQIRRVVIAIVGGLVVAIGVAMLVLPGPAIVVIPAGLAILATEFAWARRLLHRVRRMLRRRRGAGSSSAAEPDHRDRSSSLRAS
jgi:tellurite resistance protein TerC